MDVALAGPLPNERASRIQGAGGTELRVLAWPVNDPRGRVQLVHGLSEHMGRYRGVAHALNAAGWSVWGHDHRAHGESKGRRGVIGRFGDLVADVAALQARADEFAPGPGRPAVIAHSLGGLVMLRAVQSRPGVASGYCALVLSAPWLATALEIPLLTRLAMPLLRLLAKDYPVPQPLRPDRLTRDPDFAAAYAADPLVVRALAVSFFDQVQVEQREALAGGIPPELPALVLVPEKDQAADPVTTDRWALALDPAPAVWRLADTRHEPFNDVDRNNIFRRLVQWLEPWIDRERENP